MDDTWEPPRVDLGATSEVVLSRIEAVILDTLKSLAEGQLPCLEVVRQSYIPTGLSAKLWQASV